MSVMCRLCRSCQETNQIFPSMGVLISTIAMTMSRACLHNGVCSKVSKTTSRCAKCSMRCRNECHQSHRQFLPNYTCSPIIDLLSSSIISFYILILLVLYKIYWNIHKQSHQFQHCLKYLQNIWVLWLNVLWKISICFLFNTVLSTEIAQQFSKMVTVFKRRNM